MADETLNFPLWHKWSKSVFIFKRIKSSPMIKKIPFNTLILNCDTWNIVKNCANQIFTQSTSILDNSWQGFMYFILKSTFIPKMCCMPSINSYCINSTGLFLICNTWNIPKCPSWHGNLQTKDLVFLICFHTKITNYLHVVLRISGNFAMLSEW